ncbi:MAG: hypothetical protein U5Q44_06175 [Dehalococcoidia bacterium]|nr:hypothetical protein [Dehalococcoidia bacterium]
MDNIVTAVTELGIESPTAEAAAQLAKKLAEMGEPFEVQDAENGGKTFLYKGKPMQLQHFLELHLGQIRELSATILELAGGKEFEVRVRDKVPAVAAASPAALSAAIQANKRRSVGVQRFKGLGEMNAEQLWETTMRPDTRTLLQVRVEDAVEADLIFNQLMGEEVSHRRHFIQSHATQVKNLDV